MPAFPMKLDKHNETTSSESNPIFTGLPYIVKGDILGPYLNDKMSYFRNELPYFSIKLYIAEIAIAYR